MTLPLRLALWASLAGVMVVPLALVISLGLGANHLPELIEQGLLRATANSLVSSLLSAIGAVIIGTLMAFLLDRTDLPGRGAIAEGAVADLVVFDRAAIADGATYEAPWTAPSGIRLVIVGGAVVVRDGTDTGARPGRMLGAGER